jgi:spore coat protein A
VVTNGATEVWQIANLTADVHPMHFHLVNVQIINRYPISPSAPFAGAIGPVRGPDPNETGWKETVKMYPEEITTVIMQFNLPRIQTADGGIIPTPPSTRTGNHEYVWHCHILEHEEHDMMRPLVVI